MDLLKQRVREIHDRLLFTDNPDLLQEVINLCDELNAIVQQIQVLQGSIANLDSRTLGLMTFSGPNY